jgi:hypothetical protein
MQYEIGQTYTLDVYYNEITHEFDNLVQIIGKGYVDVTVLTAEGVALLKKYEQGDEIELDEDNFDYFGVESSNGGYEEGEILADPGLWVSKRFNSEKI